MRIALYHPEIPQNVGTIMRTCACFGASLDIIYPVGFIWDDKRIKRAHMDYDAHTQVTKHDDFDQFLKTYPDNPMIVLSTKAETSLCDFELPTNPIFVFGRESDGIRPEDEERLLLNPGSHRVKIPIQQRSLNLAVCVGVVFGGVLAKL